MLLIINFLGFLRGDMDSILIGQKAPDFSLQDQDGVWHTLHEFSGKKVVLYFYPKDNTPGCTQQACGLRDAYGIYKEHNITILGINYDSVQSHKNFKEKHALPFILLTDSTHEVAKAYGAYQTIVNLLFPARLTVLINEEGYIISVLKNIDVATHAHNVLKLFCIDYEGKKCFY